MKEVIYHVVASTPGRVISIAVDELLTKDNILGIINKTTGKVLYTPLKYPLLTFGLSAGTLTLTLDSSIPSISVGDHLLIKVYTDANDAMGGLIAHDCGRAIITCDYNPYVTGSDGMLISGLSVNMPDGFGVGSVVKAESLISGCKVPKSVSSPSLSYNGEGYYVSGVTEWITLEKGKAYRCTGKVAMAGSISYVYTYEEIGTAGASGREIKDEVDQLAQFFGLPQALPEIEVATEQEVKAINDDVMGALYGYGKVTVTIHSLMRTGAETTQDLASVIYFDPEKTWAENGYPTLYDDEGTAIDTTTNPAAGDEVFNYQIQSES